MTTFAQGTDSKSRDILLIKDLKGHLQVHLKRIASSVHSERRFQNPARKVSKAISVLRAALIHPENQKMWQRIFWLEKHFLPRARLVSPHLRTRTPATPFQNFLRCETYCELCCSDALHALRAIRIGLIFGLDSSQFEEECKKLTLTQNVPAAAFKKIQTKESPIKGAKAIRKFLAEKGINLSPKSYELAIDLGCPVTKSGAGKSDLALKSEIEIWIETNLNTVELFSTNFSRGRKEQAHIEEKIRSRKDEKGRLVTDYSNSVEIKKRRRDWRGS